MLKSLSLLACLGIIEHVAGHPISRRNNSTSTASVQKPLLFELTRGAPFADAAHDPKRLEKRDEILLTQTTDQYFLKLNLSGQDRYFNIDTGSGTFWVADPNFNCYNIHNQLVGPACCGLGDTLQLSASANPNAPFEQPYSSGEYAKGTLTSTQVTLDGKSWRVTLGAANNVQFEGSRIEAGVLGLAGPGYAMGDETSPDTQRATPFFPQLTKAYPNIPMLFTLGLSRQIAVGTNAPSYIEFGGRLIKAVGIATQGPTAIVPLLTVSAPIIRKTSPAVINSNGLVADYSTMDPTFKVNGVVYDDDEFVYHTVTDSGAPGLQIPPNAAYEFNKLWADKRVYIEGESFFDIYKGPEVDCATVPPTLVVRFSGIDFPIDGRDLKQVGSDGRCRSLVSGSQGFGTLGVPFLKNVVATHDLSGKRIEFTARVPY